MSSYFNLTLDTTAPASPSIVIQGGASEYVPCKTCPEQKGIVWE